MVHNKVQVPISKNQVNYIVLDHDTTTISVANDNNLDVLLDILSQLLETWCMYQFEEASMIQLAGLLMAISCFHRTYQCYVSYTWSSVWLRCPTNNLIFLQRLRFLMKLNTRTSKRNYKIPLHA